MFLKNGGQVNISNIEKAPNSWFKKNAKTMNRQFIEEEILMANKHKKSSSPSIVMETQNKTSARCFFIPQIGKNLKDR